MKYICEKCGTEFYQKSNYEKHLQRKTPCTEEEKIKYDIKKRTCEYCNEIYSTTNAVKVHMKICKQKLLKIEETEPNLKDIIINLNAELKEIKGELKEIKKQPNTVINNIQQNIIIAPYGSEDLSYITFKDYKRIFNKGCYSIPEILKLIHCNDQKPEYKNIYIKNYKDDYILTFDGKDWNVEKKEDILNNMFESKKYLLETKFEDFQEELPKNAIDMFTKFLEKTEDSEVINNIKDEMKNMFYKNRKHVIKDVKKPKKVKALINVVNDSNNLNESINFKNKPTKNK
jgi:hypothetical protein